MDAVQSFVFCVVRLVCSGGLAALLLAMGLSFARANDLDSYWTSWFSEESGSSDCNTGYVAAGVGCRGRYCDNMTIWCRRFPFENAGGYTTRWTGPVLSEEKPRNTLTGGDKGVIASMKCSGRYCDNLSLLMVEFDSPIFLTPVEVGPVSEEGEGEATCPTDSYLTGLKCDGSYCDKLTLRCSRVRSQPAVDGGRPDTGAQINVLQFNVQFLFPQWFRDLVETIDWAIEGIDVFHLRDKLRVITEHFPSTRARARAIGRTIACSDIVALNETVEDDRRRDIIAAMEEFAPTCPNGPPRFAGGRHFRYVDGPDLPDMTWIVKGWQSAHARAILDDELTIVSRFPILESHQYRYTKTDGEDKLAAKGVLHVRLDTLDGRQMDVFATHLQADNREVAVSQVAELAAFIWTHRGTNNAVVLMGDFNINGLEEEQQDPSSYYSRTLALLHQFGFTDVHRRSGPTDLGRTERLDYIFISSELQATGGFVGRNDHLSDHARVGARLRWVQ